MTDLPAKLLALICCPQSKARLVQVGDWLYSTDPKTRKKYRIIDGIPRLMVEESETATPGEFERVMAETRATNASSCIPASPEHSDK